MKRLLCFFDGTWNTPYIKDETTNIVKLHAAIPEKTRDGIRQFAHYEIGIASSGFGRLTFAAGAIGIGISDTIQSGYKFIVEHYEPGDEIYVFGFSRGAFEARCIGGLISLAGVLKAGAAGRIPDLWEYYQDHRTTPDPGKLAEFRRYAHYPARIRCIGVWDTVGNLGLRFAPRSRINQAIQFHNTELSPIVDVGLHALALDEPRGPFSPTFWTKPAGASLPEGQIVEQVWFPGSHANVGGGTGDTALSDISLLWMAERAIATTGVEIDLEALHRATNPDPLGEDLSPTAETLFRFSAVFPFVRLVCQDPRCISPWRRTIFRYWRSSKLPPGQETVNEKIHDSAVARFGKRILRRRGDDIRIVRYKPRNLAVALHHHR